MNSHLLCLTDPYFFINGTYITIKAIQWTSPINLYIMLLNHLLLYDFVGYDFTNNFLPLPLLCFSIALLKQKVHNFNQTKA